MRLLIAFIAVPLIEIGLFIQVGDAIGLWPTLLIVLLTAIAGTAFFTDAFGFLLLFPPFRNLITKMIRSKLKSADMKFSPHETGPDNTVIDAEYTDISEQNPSSGPTNH